jgi:hypothetical protein
MPLLAKLVLFWDINFTDFLTFNSEIQYFSTVINHQTKNYKLSSILTAVKKSWKNLFVKGEDDEPAKKEDHSGSFSFPVSNTNLSNQPAVTPVVSANEPAVAEVLQVYESGLDSINMPGYDFYEFYKTVISTGSFNEQTYTMAFQMAKTLDKTITPAKLLSDAEFYISKINDVHGQYVNQGQQKLNGLEERKKGEKSSLQKEIDQASLRVTQLRAELQQLESAISQKRGVLLKVDESYYPQEKSVREKLNANDMARKTSIDKLNLIKDGIQKFIKIL